MLIVDFDYEFKVANFDYGFKIVNQPSLID